MNIENTCLNIGIHHWNIHILLISILFYMNIEKHMYNHTFDKKSMARFRLQMSFVCWSTRSATSPVPDSSSLVIEEMGPWRVWRYPLVICYIANWKITMFKRYRTTISTGPFEKIALYVCLPEGTHFSKSHPLPDNHFSDPTPVKPRRGRVNVEALRVWFQGASLITKAWFQGDLSPDVATLMSCHHHVATDSSWFLDVDTVLFVNKHPKKYIYTH